MAERLQGFPELNDGFIVDGVEYSIRCEHHEKIRNELKLSENVNILNETTQKIMLSIFEWMKQHGSVIITGNDGSKHILEIKKVSDGSDKFNWLLLNDIQISKDCERFFESEIENELHGGISPSTLISALDSLRQGDEIVFDNINYNNVLAEVEDLIHKLGEDININYILDPYAFDKNGNTIWINSQEARDRFNIILPIDEEICVRKVDLIYEKLNQTEKIISNRRKTNSTIDNLGKG